MRFRGDLGFVSPCRNLLSIPILTSRGKSDQCPRGKGNKSASVSSSSHHKQMGGEHWRSYRTEPMFIRVTAPPQASRGPWGMLQAREEPFGGLEMWGRSVLSPAAETMKIHLAVNNHLHFFLTPPRLTLTARGGNIKGNEGCFHVWAFVSMLPHRTAQHSECCSRLPSFFFRG